MKKKQTSKTSKVVVRSAPKQVSAPQPNSREVNSGQKIQTAEGWRRQMIRNRQHHDG